MQRTGWPMITLCYFVSDCLFVPVHNYVILFNCHGHSRLVPRPGVRRAHVNRT